MIVGSAQCERMMSRHFAFASRETSALSGPTSIGTCRVSKIARAGNSIRSVPCACSRSFELELSDILVIEFYAVTKSLRARQIIIAKTEKHGLLSGLNKSKNITHL